MPKKLANALGSLAVMAAAHASRKQNQADDDARWMAANPGKTPPARTPTPIDKGVDWLKGQFSAAPAAPAAPTPAAPVAAPAMPALDTAAPPVAEGEMDANRLFTKQEWLDAPGTKPDAEPVGPGNSQGPNQFDDDRAPGE